MSSQVVFENIEEFVQHIAKKYAGGLGEHVKELNRITRKTSNEEKLALYQKITQMRLIRTGDYRDNWEVLGVKNGNNLEMILHNENLYMLTHLLEYEHDSTNPDKQVPAHPHIGPVEQEYNEIYIRRVTEYLRSYFGG